MRWLIAALALALTAACAEGQTLNGGLLGPGSSAPASKTPVLVSQTINEGALTQSGIGGVNLDNLLLAPGSAAASSWKIVQTNGTNGWWTNASTGAGTTQNELIPIAAPTVLVSAGGINYSTSDVLTLSNGAVIQPTTATNGVISAVTRISAPSPVITDRVGSGAGTVTVTSCATGPCAGSGATFTYQYNTPAQTPVPSSTGATNNLGGNATTPAAYVFNVSATGADASVSNTATLTVNLIADAANISASTLGTVTNTTIFGASGTKTIQAFVNACASCAGANGDLKLLVSTGSIFANPNTGPNHDDAYQFGLNNVNIGAAIIAHGGTPSTTNRLTIEDACRATGSLIAGSTLQACTVGALTTFELVSLAGTLFVTDVCDTSDPTKGSTWIAYEGLTFGGDPRDNYHTASPAGWSPAQSCDVALEYAQSSYPATISAGLMTSNPAGNAGTTVAIGLSNKHVFVNYVSVNYGSGCVIDNGTNASPSLDVQISHVWCRGFNQNGLTAGGSQLILSDVYLVAPFLYPNSGSHVDTYQLSDGLQPTSDTASRLYLLGAEGNATTQGLFMGNYSSGLPTVGWQANGIISFQPSVTLIKQQSCDSTGAQVCAIKNATAIRQNQNVPGINGAAAYAKLTFTANPSDGERITVGAGCQPTTVTGTCTQPSTATFGFCYSLNSAACVAAGIPQANQIVISSGGTAAAAVLAMETALGTAPTNGGLCDHPTALGLAVTLCVQQYVGSTSAPEVFSTVDPTLGFRTGPNFTPVIQTITFAGGGHISSAQGTNLFLIGQDNATVLTQGPNVQWNKTTSGGWGNACDVSHQWCGAYALDGVYVQGIGSLSTPAGAFTSYFTPATMSAAIGTPGPSITGDNVFGADDPQNGGTKYLHSLFTTDGAGGAGATAESNAEALTWAQWYAKTPAQVCSAYAGWIVPTPTSNLTPAGGLGVSKVVGALDTTGRWNDGSGHSPCWDLNAGAAYTTNPYPH